MDEATRQANNVTPPTSSAVPGTGVTAIATTTSNLSLDMWAQTDKAGANAGFYDRYVTLMSCGADCYYLFSAAAVTINEAITGVTIAAGTTTVVPMLLKDGVPQPVRLNEIDHRYINLKAASGTPVVRITPSSQKMASRH